MDLHEKYLQKKADIESRLREFKRVFEQGDERVFAELCFCLLTPQSKARHAWRAIENLSQRDLLANGSEGELEPWLGTVRFYKNKAKWIVEARKFFYDGNSIRIKDMLLKQGDVPAMREWLVANVRGFGYKEASHFLRNIGFYENIAILDRHILKNMVRHGAISEVPKSITPKVYLELERTLLSFADAIGIPASHLDLLFWSEETGEIFK